jgi:hypothetical protein
MGWEEIQAITHLATMLARRVEGLDYGLLNGA